MPQRYEPEGSCTDDTTWETHEHSTAHSCHHGLSSCARSRLASRLPTHLPRTANNNPQSRIDLSLSLLPCGFSHQRCRTCVTCRCVRCVHDSESVPGGTGEPANSSGSASLAALLGERGSSAIPDAASASAVPGGTSWGACTTTTPSLASSLPPKLWGSCSKHLAYRTYLTSEGRERGARGKEAFCSFLLTCIRARLSHIQSGDSGRDRRKKSLGRDSCHARMVGMGRD